MSEARNHHFVPRSYLCGFSHDTGRQARVFVVDRIEKRAFATTARNVGSKRDFNRVDIEGVEPNHMEAFYGRIEDAAALSIQRVEAAGTLENSTDLENIIVLIMILAIRNPRFRQNISSALSGVYKRVMDLSLSSKERWDAVTRRMERDGSTIRVDTNYEEMREFVDRGEYDIVTTTTGHAGLEARSYTKLINTFGDRKWTLFKAAPGAGDFITSDHPVCLFDKRAPQDGRWRRIGYATRDTVLIFPVTRRLLLWGEFSSGPDDWGEMSAGLVWETNARVASYSDRQVYAADDSPIYKSGPTAIKSVMSLLSEDWFMRADEEEK